MEKDNLLIGIFLKILAVLLIFTAVYGFIGPEFISAESDSMVIVGISMCIIAILPLYFLIRSIINNLKKLVNEKL